MSKCIDLTGKKFGRLEVICRGKDYPFPSGQKAVMWECVCDCGNFIDVRGSYLKSGHTKSCGCLQQEIGGWNFIDLTGQRFGRLTVISRTDNHTRENGREDVMWLCLCACGNILSVRGDHLRNGHTRSCGCYHNDATSERTKRNLIGQRFSRLLVVKESIRNLQKTGIVYWECLCDCGNTITVQMGNLISGNTTSCGCYQRQVASERLKGVFGTDAQGSKGGVTPIYVLIRGSDRYKLWRTQVFKRDNFRCRFCGVLSNTLSVHHIKPLSSIIKENNITGMKEALECEELWDINNGITLSEEWHMGFKTQNSNAFHSLYGNYNCTAEDFKIWFLAITPEFAKELKNVS